MDYETISAWTAKRSGATMTVTGLDSTGASITITGVDTITANAAGALAHTNDGTTYRLAEAVEA